MERQIYEHIFKSTIEVLYLKSHLANILLGVRARSDCIMLYPGCLGEGGEKGGGGLTHLKEPPSKHSLWWNEL